jgi:hypothetical protein
MTKNNQTIDEKDKLYNEIVKYCDWLCIARYLKNEAKNALKYFHEHKLSNIKKNLKEFSDYLIFLNTENCQKIENFQEWKERKRNLNNSLSYFYNYENISDSDLSSIQNKIETNSYETITLMQSIKWCLILTIDEFCNATPTRVDIMRYNLWKKKSQTKSKLK